LPPIKPQNVYKLKWWHYISHSFIKFHSVNIPFTSDQDLIHINLLDKSLIDWDKKEGYLYVHFGAIKFGLNPLVQPYLPVSSLCCVIDICHNQFFDALIGGFQAPLSDGPAFATVYPKYVVSLDDPYIYDLLKAYILPVGFDMTSRSCILQLKCMVVVRFSNDTLLPLQKNVLTTSRLHSVVEKYTSKNSQPITFDWTGISYPTSWEHKYDGFRQQMIQQKLDATKHQETHSHSDDVEISFI
jgi:hypothetical protein